MYFNERNEEQVVRVLKTEISQSKIPLIIGIILIVEKRKNSTVVTIVNPLVTQTIQLYSQKKIEIGDLIIIRNAKILKDLRVRMDEESVLEIRHSFFNDFIGNLKDDDLKLIVEDLIKWGSRQEWILNVELSMHSKTVHVKEKTIMPLSTFSFFKATFLKLFIISALDERINISEIKSKEDFINLLCNSRCDTCQKCNARREIYCVYCKCLIDKMKRSDLPDLRMELNTLEHGFLEVRLWKWCEKWFPEINRYPSGDIDNVYKRFIRVFNRIKSLKQVSMHLQQVGKVYYLMDVE